MSQRIVIVGGGIIGLCAAWYCIARGWRVTVIDRHAAERDGCSYGNAGMIVPSHFVPLAAPGMVAQGLKWMGSPASPFYVQPRFSPDLLRWGVRFWRACTRQHVERAAPLLRDLHLASRACYEQLADAWSNDFGLVRKGLLMLCHTARGFAEETRAAERAVRLGVAAEVLDAAATAALDPEVSMDVCGAVYYPRDCHLAPQRLMAVLQARLIADGCEFQWQAEVQGFERCGRRVAQVRTSHGDFAADGVVLAGGIWSAALARGLRLSLPMQAGKGYSLTLSRPPQMPALCAILSEARVAVTPLGSALRFGGTMEMSGLNETIYPARVHGIVASALRYYPRFCERDFAGITPWCGLRPCSPDGLPFLGRPAQFDNLVVATGHAMMGLSLAPITGRIVARLLAGEPPQFDLGLLAPDRYTRRRQPPARRVS
jgi:D-amino-acid dehydrogenase